MMSCCDRNLVDFCFGNKRNGSQTVRRHLRPDITPKSNTPTGQQLLFSSQILHHTNRSNKQIHVVNKSKGYAVQGECQSSHKLLCHYLILELTSKGGETFHSEKR